MRRFLVGLLACIGVLTLLAVAGLAGLGWWLARSNEPALPDAFVLTMDLRRPVAEGRPNPITGWLGGQGDYRLLDLVQALDHAARDPRVRALYARTDETAHGFATAQELRQKIAKIRQAGKPTVVFADSFGELSPANEAYYVASAFERIVLQPAGSLGLTGLSLAEPFAGGLLAKLGIGFEVTRRSEYKTALDFLAEREPSAAHREMSDALLGSLDGQFRAGIAAGRPALADALDGLIDRGPFTATEAVDAGLIDGLAYEDEVLAELSNSIRSRDRSATALERVDVADYARSTPPEASPDKVAIIDAVGPIVRGTGDLNGGVVAADDLSGALAEARMRDDIKAVVFRIASPGGSAVASETIGREVDLLRQAGKPVIVSMGDVAGSGGYWIAANADIIVADPATLTGSIGVIAGKPVLQDLWTWLEVNWVTTTTSRHGDIWSVNKPYSNEGQAKVDAAVDAIYRSFKERVGSARHMSPDQVEEVARGRVWTGEQAVKVGLVDQLGGLSDALDVVRQHIGLRPDDPIELVALPNPEAGWLHLVGRMARDLRGAAVLVDRLTASVAAGTAPVAMPTPMVQ